MSLENEICVTSRSRTPSLIDVTSQNERVFAQLPDLIQEAAVSTECEKVISERGLLLKLNSFESQVANKSSSKCEDYRYEFHDSTHVLHHNQNRFGYRAARP
jgi:hypothetical protein